MSKILDDLHALYHPDRIVRAKDRDLPQMLREVTNNLARAERWAVTSPEEVEEGEIEKTAQMVNWATAEIARRETLFVGAYDNFQIDEPVTIVADLPDWDEHVVSKPQIGMSGVVTELEIDLPTHVAIKFLSKELGYTGGRKFMTLYVKRWAVEPVNGRKADAPR